MRVRRVNRPRRRECATVTDADRARYDRAREIGRRELADYSAVVTEWFDTRLQEVGLEFRTGARMGIPRRLVPGLEGATPVDLASVTVSPAGDAVSWRSLDVDVAVRGLVENAFGGSLFIVTAPATQSLPETHAVAAPASEPLSEADAARYIGISAAWLKKSRTRRFRGTIDAPPFVRAGTKRVVYRREDLDMWLKRHLHHVGTDRE